MGRPTDSPKNTMIRVRMDAETVKIMDQQAELHNTTRSDVIRNSIRDDQVIFQSFLSSLKGGEDMIETRPCSKEDVEEMLDNYKQLADDCRRSLKRMDERPLPDDDEYRPIFKKYLQQNLLMIEFLEKYLNRFK